MVKITENEKLVKLCREYLREKCIDLHQTSTKTIFSPFYTSSDTFHRQERASFWRYLFIVKSFFGD